MIANTVFRTQQAQQRWINVENWSLRWTTKIQRWSAKKKGP